MSIKTKSGRDSSDRFGGTDPRDDGDGADPQIPAKYFVSFCDELHGRSDSDEEVEAPEPDQKELLTAVGTLIENVLTKQERYVLMQRLIGDTYATIADGSWPRLSGPSQARKIELRALRKLRERLSKFRKDLKPKLDTPDL